MEIQKTAWLLFLTNTCLWWSTPFNSFAFLNIDFSMKIASRISIPDHSYLLTIWEAIDLPLVISESLPRRRSVSCSRLCEDTPSTDTCQAIADWVAMCQLACEPPDKSAPKILAMHGMTIKNGLPIPFGMLRSSCHARAQFVDCKYGYCIENAGLYP